MKRPWQTLFQKLTSMLRERVHLALTTLALRHQLAVLQRSAKRPQFRPVDRCLWVLLSMVWARWPEALEIVQADTVRRWRSPCRRQLLRWEYGRRRPGRPAIAAETRALIRRMNQANILWGAPRLHGELAMLGIKVSRTTVAKYIVCRSGPPSPSWRTFIHNHAYDIIASGSYTECFSSLRALAVMVLYTFRQWFERVVASGLNGASRCSWRATVTRIQPSDPACAPAVWSLGRGECVSVGERGPPDARLARHSDAVSAGLPIHWGPSAWVEALPLRDDGACIHAYSNREHATPQGRPKTSHGESLYDETGG
jgi:putative transposase